MNEQGVEVRGAHPSKTAKGEAAKIVVGQRWASPRILVEGGTWINNGVVVPFP